VRLSEALPSRRLERRTGFERAVPSLSGWRNSFGTLSPVSWSAALSFSSFQTVAQVAPGRAVFYAATAHRGKLQDVAGRRHKSMSASTAYWSIAKTSWGVNSRFSSAPTFCSS
jgi:hypothetical protein